MNEKQKETLEWLDKLEQYAKEKQLSMRILDSIDECRKNVVSENVNWNQISIQVEELLDSIEKKVLPAVAQVYEGDNEVSVTVVENELKSMAQRCHTENENSINSFENRKDIILQRLFINLQDITRVKAHLQEMKNEDSYQVFFQRAKGEYHNNVLSMVRELLQSVSNNHRQMMERMKSMMQSIKAYRHGLSSERLYREYDTKTVGLDSKIQNEIERLETGEEEIVNFARKTRETINSIVQKLERKRKMRAWLPAIIIVCVLLAGAVSMYVEISSAMKGIKESASETSGIQVEDVKEMLDSAKGLYESMSGAAEVAGSISIAGIAVYGIFIFLVVGLIYALYLFLLKWWCNCQICSKCGTYLNAELANFEKNNTLRSRMNDMVNVAVEEYEQQYAVILNELLAGSSFDPESEEKKEAYRFTEVKNSWNAIKYK